MTIAGAEKNIIGLLEFVVRERADRGSYCGPEIKVLTVIPHPLRIRCGDLSSFFYSDPTLYSWPRLSERFSRKDNNRNLGVVYKDQ